MNTILKRSAVAASALALAGGAAAFTASSAAAADGDPITGGSTTFAVPHSTVLANAKNGIVAVTTAPGTLSYDSSNKADDFVLPVDGGNGSVNSDYGAVDNSGGLLISDVKTGKSVTLTDIKFSLQTLRVYGTPSTGTKKSTIIANVGGSHTFSNDPSTGRQEYTGDDVTLDKAGADALNKGLGVTTFKAGQHLGTFDTVFTNTQY